MLLKPFGFNRKEAAPSGGGITITQKASPAYNESNLSTYTWSSINLGNLAIVHNRGSASGNGLAPTLVTIGGETASIVQGFSSNPDNFQNTSFWYASAAPNTGTGNTVVQFAATQARAFLRQFDVQGANMTPVAVYSDTDNDSVAGSVTVTTVPSGGAIIAASRSFTTITGLANVEDTGDDPKVAWEVFPSGATDVVVGGTNAPASDQDLVIIVLEPA